MTERQVEKRVSMLQYLNTGLLTLICGFSVMAATELTAVKTNQSEIGKELIRMKTVQDINVENIKNVSNELSDLQLRSLTDYRTWVDNNYVRKPQVK